jgi:copper resistance protein B
VRALRLLPYLLAGAIALLPFAGFAQDHTDHSKMDHAKMDHSGHEPAEKKTPPATQSGPPNAADAIWGEDAMRASRAAVYKEHGDMDLFWLQGDRAEYRIRQGKDGYLWDMQGYYGGDIDKFWFKSEGEGSFGKAIEQAEFQALWSRAIGPFFDLQAGVRKDLHGPDRTHLVLGVQGVAPYFLEIDVASFLSNTGDLTARIEGEYDHRLTQRLIIQPRAEINLSAQNIPELEIGAGIDNIEAGLRLRYEISPEFAPYLGIEQEWKLGNSRDFALADGEDPSVTNYVVGLRFWF